MKTYKNKKCLTRKQKQACLYIGIGFGAVVVCATAPLWIPVAKVKAVQEGAMYAVTVFLA